MFRIPIAAAVFVTVMALSELAAFAQSSFPKPKYPADIAAASRRLAEKRADCQRQAQEQKLTALQRRRSVRACIKN
jgi:hypothetical protein